MYHSKLQVNPGGVKSSTYVGIAAKNNRNDPKLEVGNRVRISKYKNILKNVAIQICPKKFL